MKRKRPKLKEPETIGAVLLEKGEQRFARSKLAVPRHVWAEMVGPNVARRTEPRTMDRGILTIVVASSAWSAELSFSSEVLMNRLRQRGYVVERLRFVVGKVEPPNRPFERPPDVVPTLGAIPADLERELAVIADDELRAELRKAARAGLARTRFVDETLAKQRRRKE